MFDQFKKYRLNHLKSLKKQEFLKDVNTYSLNEQIKNKNRAKYYSYLQNNDKKRQNNFQKFFSDKRNKSIDNSSKGVYLGGGNFKFNRKQNKHQLFSDRSHYKE